MALFRGLPDQKGGGTGTATLRHDSSIFLPASIQGGSATYFFDTGAWLSCMSESEAKRLGLSVHAAEGAIGTSTGTRVGLRTAVAREVTVGGTRFEDVSFAVFPDDQEPWSVLPPGRCGILGIPLLSACAACVGATTVLSRSVRSPGRPASARPTCSSTTTTWWPSSASRMSASA